MSKSAVLYISDAFAEFGIVGPLGLEATSQWYAGRESLNKALGRFLLDHSREKLTEVVVASKSLAPILRKRLGTAPALLLTAGFENWLELNRPIRQTHFTVAAERAPSILDSSLVFGVSERMGPDGVAEKPVDLTELEFLAAKLKLNNVQAVAIGFLHSHKNPEHELVAANYLRQQGFRVFASAELSAHSAEVPRWWTAVTAAYLTAHHEHGLDELKSALTESGQSEVKIRYLSGDGLVSGEQALAPIASLVGPLLALHKWRQRVGTQTLLYLGVEDFWVLDGRWQMQACGRVDFGQIAMNNPGHLRPDVQATQLIEKSFWGGASLSAIEGGFEPGPMCLGKGVSPQFFDLIWWQGRFDSLTALQDRFADRARARLEETLAAMSREAFAGQQPSIPAIVNILEESAVQRLMWQVPDSDGELMICGPLATALRPALEKVLLASQRPATWHTDQSVILSSLTAFTESAQQGGD